MSNLLPDDCWQSTPEIELQNLNVSYLASMYYDIVKMTTNNNTSGLWRECVVLAICTLEKTNIVDALEAADRGEIPQY